MWAGGRHLGYAYVIYAANCIGEVNKLADPICCRARTRTPTYRGFTGHVLFTALVPRLQLYVQGLAVFSEMLGISIASRESLLVATFRRSSAVVVEIVIVLERRKSI